MGRGRVGRREGERKERNRRELGGEREMKSRREEKGERKSMRKEKKG